MKGRPNAHARYRDLIAARLDGPLTRTELRTLESVPAMALFSATTFVLFRFGLDRDSLEGSLAEGSSPGTFVFTPSEPLEPGTTYRVTLEGLEDMDGAALRVLSDDDVEK